MDALLDTSVEERPRSILKSRTPRPSVTTAPSPLQCCRNRLLQLPSCCARRRPKLLALHWQAQGRRINWYALSEVIEYTTAIGHDGVPADGTDLAVGLGRPTSQRFVPLQRKYAKPLGEISYVPVEQRTKRLQESAGEALLARHCNDTAQVKELRNESNRDAEEPHELMPVSYQQAKDRAAQIAKEVYLAADDPLAMLLAESRFSPEKEEELCSARKRLLSSAESDSDSSAWNKAARFEQ